MFRKNRFVSLLLLVALLISACQPVVPERAELGLDVEATKPILDETTVAEIERLIEQTMAENQIPGFAIGIVMDGEVVYLKGFGLAEVDTDQTMTPETLIPVASLSKQFTAAAIMQLFEEGKISLDAPVTDYLPYFKMADPRHADMAIRQLLSHTSGMPQISQREYGYDSRDPGVGARETHVRELAEFNLDAAPGETWAYSNLGYNVLGEVIAKISGETYEEYVQRHILAPLGMDSSTFILGEIDFNSLARGHYPDEAGNVMMTEDFPYTRAYAPAAGLVTNLTDLMRWASALSNYGELAGVRILKASSCDEMWSRVTTLGWGGLFEDYGLGWILAESDGHRLVWHLGTNPGYQANVIVAPDEGIGIVTLDNFLSMTEDQPWSATDVGNAVMLKMLDVEVTKPTVEETTLDPPLVTNIDSYVGDMMAESALPGVAVGIVKGGTLAYAQGYGVAELGSEVPVTPDSIFHTASVAKTAVAIGIMQLVEQGEIDLDAPVIEYLPYFTMADPMAEQMTIRELVAHTAGFPDVEDWIIEWRDKTPRYDEAALEDYVRSFAEMSLLFVPGEGWSYSSEGFEVLGDVIAKVSGQSFETYMQEQILAPLGMTNSTFFMPDADPMLLLTPHMYDEDGNAEISNFFPYSRIHGPSSTLYANVNDMARYAIAQLNLGELDGTRILNAATYDEMWTAQAATGYDEWAGPMLTDYGLGWWLGDVADHRTIGGHGADPGFQSALILLPDDDAAVIVMVNLWDPAAGALPAFDIGQAVTEFLLGVER